MSRHKQRSRLKPRARKSDSPPPQFFTLHERDARDLDGLLRDYSSPQRPLITSTISSPPYGPLRDYGHPAQIGFGQAHEQYLDEMRSIFAALHTHTRMDGSLWLIADTFRSPSGSPRRLVPLPFDLASLAEDVGWTLRDVIIWEKDRTLPWSNGTRLRNGFEYVLLLVKGPNAKYRLDRLRDPGHPKEWWVRFPERYNPEGKAPSNVWTIPIPLRGTWGRTEIEHSCPLPPDLVERLVLLTTDPGDIVFDAFAGSGIVVAEAARLKRRGLGCELVAKHVREFESIVRPEIAARRDSNGTDLDGARKLFRETVIALRIVKFAKVLMERVARRRLRVAWPSMTIVLNHGGRPPKGKHARLTLLFVVNGNRAIQREFERAADEERRRPPASKFGLEVALGVIGSDEVVSRIQGRRIYLYANGQTNRGDGPIRHRDLPMVIDEHLADPLPPIISDVLVDVPARGADAALAAGDLS